MTSENGVLNRGSHERKPRKGGAPQHTHEVSGERAAHFRLHLFLAEQIKLTFLKRGQHVEVPHLLTGLWRRTRARERLEERATALEYQADLSQRGIPSIRVTPSHDEFFFYFVLLLFGVRIFQRYKTSTKYSARHHHCRTSASLSRKREIHFSRREQSSLSAPQPFTVLCPPSQ